MKTLGEDILGRSYEDPLARHVKRTVLRHASEIVLASAVWGVGRLYVFNSADLPLDNEASLRDIVGTMCGYVIDIHELSDEVADSMASSEVTRGYVWQCILRLETDGHLDIDHESGVAWLMD